MGWWPGGGNVAGPAFYSYAAPAPEGFSSARVRPDAARWDSGLGEFVLLYDDVRASASPSRALLEFAGARMRRRHDLDSGIGGRWRGRGEGKASEKLLAKDV